MPRKEKEENWFLDSSVTTPALKGRFRISPDSGVFMECEFSLEPEMSGPQSRGLTPVEEEVGTCHGVPLNTECCGQGHRSDGSETRRNQKKSKWSQLFLSIENNTVTYLVFY